MGGSVRNSLRKLGGANVAAFEAQTKRLLVLIQEDKVEEAQQLADRLALDLAMERVKRRSAKEIQNALDLYRAVVPGPDPTPIRKEE